MSRGCNLIDFLQGEEGDQGAPGDQGAQGLPVKKNITYLIFIADVI